MLFSEVLMLFCVVMVCEWVGKILDSMVMERLVFVSCSDVCMFELFVLMIIMLNLWCGSLVLIVIMF